MPFVIEPYLQCAGRTSSYIIAGSSDPFRESIKPNQTSDLYCAYRSSDVLHSPPRSCVPSVSENERERYTTTKKKEKDKGNKDVGGYTLGGPQQP
jgi:hypothetical protein